MGLTKYIDMKKVAFCFATYENMSHPKIWEDFFAQADPDQYVIHTHAKYPEAVTQSLVKNHLISEHYDTTWGGIKLARLWLRMFHLAFENQSVYKAINLSQSCVPIRSFQETYESLTQTDKGFMGWCDCSTNDPERRWFQFRYQAIKDKNLFPATHWVGHMAEGIVVSREMNELNY